jgi:uncharacterized protein (TIGR02246 family)
MDQSKQEETFMLHKLKLAVVGYALAAVCSQGVSAAEAMTDARAADTVAIQQLIVKYAHVYDSLDVEGYVSIFTDDAKFTFTGNELNGRAAIREFISGAKQRREAAPASEQETKSFHSISNTRIQFDSDTMAHHRSYWQVVSCTTGTPCAITNMGYYDDVVVKQDGEWLIQSRNIPQ